MSENIFLPTCSKKRKIEFVVNEDKIQLFMMIIFALESLERLLVCEIFASKNDRYKKLHKFHADHFCTSRLEFDLEVSVRKRCPFEKPGGTAR
jgi:hypothetical protein